MGVMRGACKACSCADYLPPTKGFNCVSCSHKPVDHHAVDSKSGKNIPTCKLPGCNAACYEENGKFFDYCKRSHATEHRSKAENRKKCGLPGCSLPVFDNGATSYDYCGKTHAKEHKEELMKEGTCTKCRTGQAVRSEEGKSFCISCQFKEEDITNYYSNGDIAIGFLPRGSTKFADIKSQFTSKWLHSPTTPPTVQDVLVVMPSAATRKAYHDYRNGLEAAGQFSEKSRSTGNECRRFHGTARTCTLGLDGNAEPCTTAGCKVCNIIRTRFMINYSGQNFGWGRFGKGMYFTSTSSKSHDYNALSDCQDKSGKHTRVMFVTKVALGRGFKAKTNMLDLKAPPEGYHSVLGEVGQDLNYDECVVYAEDAALAAYLIVYNF